VLPVVKTFTDVRQRGQRPSGKSWSFTGPWVRRNRRNSVEHSRPWEADSRSVGQEILWNKNVHYRVHKSPQLHLIPGQV